MMARRCANSRVIDCKAIRQEQADNCRLQMEERGDKNEKTAEQTERWIYSEEYKHQVCRNITEGEYEPVYEKLEEIIRLTITNIQ